MSSPPDEHRKGSRTLLETLDYLASVQPHRAYASIPTSIELSRGFREVTLQDMVHAIDVSAWWLSNLFGKSDSFETVAYVGVADLRYVVFFYGAIKCGYKSFFVSGRLTTVQTLPLLEQTQCTKLFHSPELAPKALELQSQMTSLTVTSFPPLDSWLALYTKPFPYDRSFADAKWDPVVVLHSSGSTGPPKPITLPFGYFAHTDTAMPPVLGREAPGFEIFDFETTGRFYSPSPPYHLSGVLALCVYPVYGKNATVVLGPPDRPPNGEIIKQIMNNVKLNLLWSLPMFVEQVAKMPGGMEELQSLDHLCYTGGPLARWCGEALTGKVKISSFYGSTEAGGAPLLLSRREDWEYLEFHPCYRASMVPVIDGLCELVLPDSPTAAPYKGNVWTFPDRKEWRTGDLFEGHASKPGLWRYHGRCDDIITMPSGQKLNPIPLETSLLSHPTITGAVVIVVGDGCDTPALLLEPAEPVASPEAFIEDAWPLVESFNAAAPTHTQINRSKVAVVQPRGLVRAPKGTVVRKLTTERFRDFIEDLYQEQQNGRGRALKS